MVVRSAATFLTSVQGDGWIVKDAQGIARLAIDDTGTLTSEGTLSTRTTPQRTSSGDFVIRTASGADAAVITQSGAVSITGDFIEGADPR